MRRKPQWVFLMVEKDGGRTIRLRGFKALLTLWLLFTVVAVSAAGLLYLLYDESRREALELRTRVELLTQKYAPSARSAPTPVPIPVAEPLETTTETSVESEDPPTVPAPDTAATEPPPAANPLASAGVPGNFLITAQPVVSSTAPEVEMTPADETDSTPATDAAAEAVPPPVLEIEAAPPPPEKSRIALEGFGSKWQSSGRRLRVKFNLRVLDPSGGPVLGHIVTVLHTAGGPDTWKTLPAGIPLVNGRPDGRTEGDSFSISRFKSVEFWLTDIPKPGAFTRATVYIFDRDGASPMVRREFQISREG